MSDMNSVILNSPSGADLSLIVELAKKLNVGVMPLSDSEIEQIEELKLLRAMNVARAEGLADRGETLAKLGL